MSLNGKGFFTWKIPACEKGSPAGIAAAARTANLDYLLIKIADGPNAYNGTWGQSTDLNGPVIQALRSQGVQAWGWHYVYGDNPIDEARIAIQKIRQFNLDGYVIDAEAQYETQTKRAAARRFMAELRSALPNIPIALSSYRYPSLHAQLPWAEFLEFCDYVMPQVYWMQAHNPGTQLIKTVREFQSLTPQRPVIPTGAAFREHGWQPTASEVVEFMQTAKKLNLSSVNFWEWSDARSDGMPGIWEAIRDFAWSGAPPDMCQKFIDALNTGSVDTVISLYNPSAVHINAVRTAAGIDALRAWYTTLFNQYLPGGKFKLTGFAGTGASRHFTWTAISSRGKVENGNDTLGLANDKIAYHYTFFTVTNP